MKKKLFAVIVLVLVSVFVLVACDGIFVKNAERDYNQTVANIKYQGYTSEVRKGELVEYFNQYAQTYMGYGYTAEECLDEFTTSLARNELLIMFALYELTDQNSKNVPEGKQINKMDPAELEVFLEADEILWARKQSNKQFRDSIEELVKSYKDKDDDDDDEIEDKDTARDQPVAASETFEDADLSEATADELAEWAKKLEEEGFFLDEAKGYKYDEVNDYDYPRAWRNLKKNLNKRFFDEKDDKGVITKSFEQVAYDYFYRKQLQSRLLQKFQDKLTAGEAQKITSEDILNKYAEIISGNIGTVTNNDTYKTAYEGTSNLFFHKEKGYFKVRSLLLKFSSEQEKVIEQLKKNVLPDDPQAYKEMREDLAIGRTSWNSDAPSSIYGVSTGIKVKISNLEYDSAEDRYSEMYLNDYNDEDHTFTGVDINLVLKQISADLISAEETARKAGKNEIEVAMSKLQVFDAWMYSANDDSGMFNSGALKEYVVTPEGQTSSYVEEYTQLAREVGKYGLGASSFSSYNSTTQKVEFDPSANTKFGTGDNEVNVGYREETSGITYVVNDFGIHIVFVTAAALPETDEQQGNYPSDPAAEVDGMEFAYWQYKKYYTDSEIDGYVLDLNYIYNFGYVVNKDSFEYLEELGEFTGLKKLVIKTAYDGEKQKSILEMLKELVEDERIYNSYATQEKKLFDDYQEDSITRNKSVYNALLKEVKKVS